MILYLGYLGHCAWRFNRVDARRGLNLAEKVLVPYMLETKLCVISRSSIDNRRAFIEKHREEKHAVVMAADD